MLFGSAIMMFKGITLIFGYNGLVFTTCLMLAGFSGFLIYRAKIGKSQVWNLTLL